MPMSQLNMNRVRGKTRAWFSRPANIILLVFLILLIVLPLYPKTVGDYVYSVNLFSYTETTALNHSLYWVMFLALVFAGAAEIALTQFKKKKMLKSVVLTVLP